MSTYDEEKILYQSCPRQSVMTHETCRLKQSGIIWLSTCKWGVTTCKNWWFWPAVGQYWFDNIPSQVTLTRHKRCRNPYVFDISRRTPSTQTLQFGFWEIELFCQSGTPYSERVRCVNGCIWTSYFNAWSRDLWECFRCNWYIVCINEKGPFSPTSDWDIWDECGNWT